LATRAERAAASAWVRKVFAARADGASAKAALLASAAEMATARTRGANGFTNYPWYKGQAGSGVHFEPSQNIMSATERKY
jgi:hypothetical protein